MSTSSYWFKVFYWGQFSNWCFQLSLWLVDFQKAAIWLAKRANWLASIWKPFWFKCCKTKTNRFSYTWKLTDKTFCEFLGSCSLERKRTNQTFLLINNHPFCRFIGKFSNHWIGFEESTACFIRKFLCEMFHIMVPALNNNILSENKPCKMFTFVVSTGI